MLLMFQSLFYILMWLYDRICEKYEICLQLWCATAQHDEFLFVIYIPCTSLYYELFLTRLCPLLFKAFKKGSIPEFVYYYRFSIVTLHKKGTLVMASLCKTPCHGNVHMLHFDLPYVDAKSVTVSGSENVMLPFSCPLMQVPRSSSLHKAHGRVGCNFVKNLKYGEQNWDTHCMLMHVWVLKIPCWCCLVFSAVHCQNMFVFCSLYITLLVCAQLWRLRSTPRLTLPSVFRSSASLPEVSNNLFFVVYWHEKALIMSMVTFITFFSPLCCTAKGRTSAFVLTAYLSRFALGLHKRWNLVVHFRQSQFLALPCWQWK